MGRNKSEMNKVPKVAKTGEFVLILWKKIDRNNKLSWSIQPVSTVKNLLQLQNPQICDEIESRLTNKPFKDCKSHLGYVVSRGTKSALEKNPDQTIEDFHKLLTDVNNSQASTSEDNDEEEDDDQTDEEDQSKPDDSSSEHSNAKSSSAANKKDQQIEASTSISRKRTAEKDYSYQLSDAPRASADLDVKTQISEKSFVSLILK